MNLAFSVSGIVELLGYLYQLPNGTQQVWQCTAAQQVYPQHVIGAGSTMSGLHPYFSLCVCKPHQQSALLRVIA